MEEIYDWIMSRPYLGTLVVATIMVALGLLIHMISPLRANRRRDRKAWEEYEYALDHPWETNEDD